MLGRNIVTEGAGVLFENVVTIEVCLKVFERIIIIIIVVVVAEVAC